MRTKKYPDYVTGELKVNVENGPKFNFNIRNEFSTFKSVYVWFCGFVNIYLVGTL